MRLFGVFTIIFMGSLILNSFLNNFELFKPIEGMTDENDTTDSDDKSDEPPVINADEVSVNATNGENNKSEIGVSGELVNGETTISDETKNNGDDIIVGAEENTATEADVTDAAATSTEADVTATDATSTEADVTATGGDLTEDNEISDLINKIIDLENYNNDKIGPLVKKFNNLKREFKTLESKIDSTNDASDMNESLQKNEMVKSMNAKSEKINITPPENIGQCKEYERDSRKAIKELLDIILTTQPPNNEIESMSKLELVKEVFPSYALKWEVDGTNYKKHSYRFNKLQELNTKIIANNEDNIFYYATSIIDKYKK